MAARVQEKIPREYTRGRPEKHRRADVLETIFCLCYHSLYERAD